MNTYRWSWFFVGGLLLSTAALCFCGVFPLFLPLTAEAALAMKTLCVVALACAAAFALATSQVAMTAAQHALERRADFPATFWCAVACAIICGLVSILGVHLSWHFLTIGRPDLRAYSLGVDAAGFALGIVKPLMAFVIEGRKRLDRIADAEREAFERAEARARTDADRAAAEARTAEAQALTAQALRQARETAEEPAQAFAAPTPPPVSERRSTPPARPANARSNAKPGQRSGARRAVVRTAAAAGAALVPNAAAADAPAIVQQAEIVSRVISEAEIIAVCLNMRQRGVTPSFRTIAEELRVPRWRIVDAWPRATPWPGDAAISAQAS